MLKASCEFFRIVLEHLLTFFAGTQRSEERTLDAVSTARVLTRQAGRAHPWREEWFSRAANRRFLGRLQMLPMHVLVPARFPTDARSRVAYDVLPRWMPPHFFPCVRTLIRKAENQNELGLSGRARNGDGHGAATSL